ncbi:MAG: malate synthase A [Deinococcales bacterium]
MLTLTKPVPEAAAALFSAEALEFVAKLESRFGGRRRELLALRDARALRLKNGEMPGFLDETAAVRSNQWTVAPLPYDLQDRRTEITGPVDRKMVINALNSGAKVFMADFEDANSPTWSNTTLGQLNLLEANKRTIKLETPDKTYSLGENLATLKVRPRGWHLEERHARLHGVAVSASLFDFGIYFFNNVHVLLARGSAPYFYLPKLESYLEARLWNDVFVFAQNELGVPCGTIRATVLIETILAAFEMEEILYELREHSSGLNCGRWDYIFSFIKKLGHDPRFVLPDRAKVTMATQMMRSYSRLAIQTCHKRKAPAIGGMSAFIPVKNDPEANERAFMQVRLDKEREAEDGHDGTWVAHPGLVPVALEVFNRLMPAPNQIEKIPDVQILESDLLAVPQEKVTRAGLEMNVSVALQYLEAWLRGAGAVPINNLMEDAATAEISRAQLWQWVHHQVVLEDGEVVTRAMVLESIERHLGQLKAQGKRFEEAAMLLIKTTEEPFADFLTISAYQILEG